MKKKFLSILFSAILVLSLIPANAFAITEGKIYEAEDATLVGASKISESGSASSGKYVSDFNNPATDYVEFKVNVPAAGTYNIEVYATSGMDGIKNDITVNGKTQTISVPNNGWANFTGAVVNASVELQAGENVLKYAVSEENLYTHLDAIKVLPLAEEPPVTEPPAEEPPVTEPPAEEPPVTESPVEEPVADGTVYEAEDATLKGAAKISESGTASSGKYVSDFNDPASDFVEFTINVPEAGTYSIEIYATTDMDGITNNITVNGKTQTISVPKNGWSYFTGAVVIASIELQAGDNVLKYAVSEKDFYTHLDAIKVLPLGTVQPPVVETPKENPEFKPTKLEAEDATLVGAAKVELSDSASGGKYVNGYDNPDTDWVEFVVNVPKAGKYNLELAYATPMEAANVVVYINGSKNVITTPPTADWGIFGVTTTSVELQEGENTLKFVKGEGYVQLDYIKLLPFDESAIGTKNPAKNPKTGDAGILQYGLLAVLALGGLVVTSTNRRRSFQN
ncbi:MAG: CBM35 domain-containing protein [Neobacillus sp.]